MEYAGFWRRFGAIFIDGVIGWLVGVVLGVVTRSPIAVSIVFAFLYEPLFLSSVLQGTPGKALLGLRITDLHGNRITFKKAIIRYLMKLVSGFALFIGYLIQPFTEKKQTLHDIVAETLVVRGEVPNQNYFQAWYNQLLEVLGMVDKVPAKRETPPMTSPSSTATPSDLAGLYELFQKGILTEAEYNQKREDLLKKI
jgi:uncharacterized RDD family membrane protein YckC